MPPRFLDWARKTNGGATPEAKVTGLWGWWGKGGSLAGFEALSLGHLRDIWTEMPSQLLDK